MGLKFLTPKEILLNLLSGEVLRETINSEESKFCYYKFENNLFWWRVYRNRDWMMIKDTDINSFATKNLIVDYSESTLDSASLDFGFGK